MAERRDSAYVAEQGLTGKHAADYSSDGQKPRISGEDVVLIFLFGVLLVGVLSVLILDFRALANSGAKLDMPFLRHTETVQPVRPGNNKDQVRRYSPQTGIDFGPGGKVVLPGVSGKPDNLLSGSMTFYDAGNGVASAVGFIEAGTATSFREYIAAREDKSAIRTLYLHSPGGSVRDAIDMARIIRDQGIETILAKHAYCASSCPLVFSGGAKRKIDKPAALGVHQVFTSDTATGTLQQGIANAQSISADAQQLLIEMGVDPRAWIEAMATPKDKLYLFSDKEIADLKWVQPKS
ncbi:MAG: hypothetical protein H2045_02130 [Rhizobiales bacterium]|nr:hypothetical protein [Hyphomicrobiales bacterium]